MDMHFCRFVGKERTTNMEDDGGELCPMTKDVSSSKATKNVDEVGQRYRCPVLDMRDHGVVQSILCTHRI